ncbi:T9SS type A sorting domain-containing protein [Geofilum rubicundum]
MYTIEGRKISEVPARSSRTLILLPDERGVYIIRAKFGNQVKSERVIGGM